MCVVCHPHFSEVAVSFKLKLKTGEETPEIRKWLDEVAEKAGPVFESFLNSPEYKEFIREMSLEHAITGQAIRTQEDYKEVVDKYMERIRAN